MADTDAIRARRDRWVTVVNARDRAGYAGLFTSDGVWLPPGLAGVSGRDAIRDWLAPFFEQFEYQFSVTAPKLRIAGAWAVECGAFTSNLRSIESGERSGHSGTYVILWRREPDGEWYIERYVDVTGMLSSENAEK